MLVREGADRNDQIDIALAVSLAFVAGALNAAAFYSAGFFAANMTGNVSAASDYLMLGSWHTMFYLLLLLVLFVMGAMASSMVIGAGVRQKNTLIYSHALLIEAVLLAIMGGLAALVGPTLQSKIFVGSTAFLMGFQNAVVTKISGARVRTTHISGMATDLGIEMAGIWRTRFGAGPAEVAVRYRSQFKLHALTILAFFAGGASGVLLFQGMGAAVMLIAGTAVAGVAVAGMLTADLSRESMK